MNHPQHAHRDEEGGNILPMFAAGNGTGTSVGHTSIRPPQVLDGDTAWELYRRGEPPTSLPRRRRGKPTLTRVK